MLGNEPDHDWVHRVSCESKGRLGVSCKYALRWGIQVRGRGFLVGDRLVRPRELWSVGRKILVKHIKGQHATRLAERRPTRYHGLSSFNTKQHLVGGSCLHCCTLSQDLDWDSHDGREKGLNGKRICRMQTWRTLPNLLSFTLVLSTHSTPFTSI